jgi:hypothetical protein
VTESNLGYTNTDAQDEGDELEFCPTDVQDLFAECSNDCQAADAQLPGGVESDNEPDSESDSESGSVSELGFSDSKCGM